jgi:hypothetical protein
MPGEPICTVIVFCDLIVTEQGTGKNSLIGSFPSLMSPSFPLVIPRFFVHVSIANFVTTGQKVNIAVNLKNVATGAVVASVGMPVTIPPMTVQTTPARGMGVNLNIPLMNVTFMVPGAYKCEVLVDGEPTGDGRILDVLQIPQQPPANITAG